MNRFPKGPDASRTASAGQPSAPETDLSTLFNYPSLGRLFDTPNSPALAEMRTRLARTNQDLERVIRQGSKEDAERATRASRAYKTALALLDSLEELQRQSPRQE